MKNITFEMRGSNGLKNTNFNFNFSHYSLGEWTIPNPTKNSPKIFIFRNRFYECPDTKNNNECYLPLDEDTVHNQHYRRTWPKYHFAFEMKNILRKNSTFEPFIIDNFASGKAKKNPLILHLLLNSLHSLPKLYLPITSVVDYWCVWFEIFWAISDYFFKVS